MRTKRWALVTIGLAVALGATEVLACGGCFAPPGAVQVVTDHRMVLALSSTQTTLWDQFSYSGRPSEFSWILPIRYTDRLQVAIADDNFLTFVNNVTSPRLVQPNDPWPPCPGPPFSGGFADASFSSDAPSADRPAVVVLRMETVGPYAVSIIRGTDPMAIRDWLRDNGYSVPSAISPVIDHYTALSMDYIALRLRPAGEGVVPRMQPVRVTMEGYVPSLPLRMIAAGVADRVGLSLVVFANSRIEAENFPNGELSDADFTWDWARSQNPSTDFLNAFTALNNSNGRRLWLTEMAARQETARWFIPPSSMVTTVDAGGAISTTPTNPMDDVRLITAALGASPYVTRLRADLPAAMLDRDLALQASDRATRSETYQYGAQLNVPPRPVCPSYDDAGMVARRDAGAVTTDIGGTVVSDAGAVVMTMDSGTVADAGVSTAPTPATASGGASCAVDVAGATKSGWGAWALGALACAAGWRRRRRG